MIRIEGLRARLPCSTLISLNKNNRELFMLHKNDVQLIQEDLVEVQIMITILSWACWFPFDW